MSWRVARSLDVLLEQLDRHAPRRSKASDGSIGDPAHSARTSDHNPLPNGVVCARDFTHDPKDGADMERLANQLKASKDPRIKYVIWNRRIFAGEPGPSPWRWRAYSGSNPHDKHLHLSVRPEARYYDATTKWPVFGEKPPRILRRGDEGAAVERLQRRLNRYFREHQPKRQTLTVDGDFGPATERAVQALERREKLTVNGIVGESVHRILEDY